MSRLRQPFKVLLCPKSDSTLDVQCVGWRTHVSCFACSRSLTPLCMIMQSRELSVDVTHAQNTDASHDIAVCITLRMNQSHAGLRVKRCKLASVARLAATPSDVVLYVHGTVKSARKLQLTENCLSCKAISWRCIFIWPGIPWHGFRPAHILVTAELEA